MPQQAPARLSLISTGDGFTLRKNNADGTENTMPLTADDVVTLLAHAEHLRQQIENKASRGALSPITATEVEKIQVASEALEDKLLILMTSFGGSRANFAVSRTLAQQLALTLQRELARMGGASPPTRQ